MRATLGSYSLFFSLSFLFAIEDAYIADETFTMLMGEEVEPRKQFIEENAVFATDLDI